MMLCFLPLLSQEVAVVGLLSYLTYLAAEMFGLSSILALFVCGLTVSHVALPTMSATGRVSQPVYDSPHPTASRPSDAQPRWVTVCVRLK